MINEIVEKFVKENNYTKYVIAYSGGIDSQVLLHAFAKAVPNKVVAYHINHGISSNASYWENFCKSHCENLGVEFFVSHFDLKDQSNLEDKARVARYGAFSQLITSKECALVTAHHLDDQAETFFLNLMRGSGLDGLSSMPETKSFAEGFHVRPLLSVSKDQITAYAFSEALNWVEDESNKDTVYDRNFIRNEVMPLLKTRWTHAAVNMGASVKHIQEAKSYIDNQVEKFDVKTTQVSIDDLNSLNSYEKIQVLRKWVYHNLGKSASQNMINTLLNTVMTAKEDAKMKWEQKDYFITRFNGCLHFVKKVEKIYNIKDLLKSAGITVNEDANVTSSLRVMGAKIKVKGNYHKEVKKIFQEMKIPSWERECLPYIYIDGDLVSVGGIINNPDYQS